MTTARQYRVKWKREYGFPRPSFVVDDGDVFMAVSHVPGWGLNAPFPPAEPEEVFDLIVTLYPAEEVKP